MLARLDENAAAFAEEAENLEEIRSDGVGGEDFFCWMVFVGDNFGLLPRPPARKTNMTMESQPFEDVFPIEN